MELLADTAYGSDNNHRRRQRHGVELVSPAPGKASGDKQTGHVGDIEFFRDLSCVLRASKMSRALCERFADSDDLRRAAAAKDSGLEHLESGLFAEALEATEATFLEFMRDC